MGINFIIFFTLLSQFVRRLLRGENWFSILRLVHMLFCNWEAEKWAETSEGYRPESWLYLRRELLFVRPSREDESQNFNNFY